MPSFLFMSFAVRPRFSDESA